MDGIPLCRLPQNILHFYGLFYGLAPGAYPLLSRVRQSGITMNRYENLAMSTHMLQHDFTFRNNNVKLLTLQEIFFASFA
jgi:hypothetical protein